MIEKERERKKKEKKKRGRKERGGEGDVYFMKPPFYARTYSPPIESIESILFN